MQFLILDELKTVNDLAQQEKTLPTVNAPEYNV